MSSHFPNPAYRINTRRMVLRCYNPEDAALLKASAEESKAHLLTYMPWAAEYPRPVEEVSEMLRGFRSRFDAGQDFIYGVFNPDETRVLGGTGLHTRLGKDALEIGYWIHKDYTGQGLATELSAALTKVAFEIAQVQRVEIHCAVENAASAAVPRKLGYTLDGTLRRRNLLLDGRYHDTMIWSLFHDEYPGSPAAKTELQAFDGLGRRLL